MKNLIFILMLSFYSTLLFAQVNFELDFSFEKIDPDDILKNLQLFDYNDDGIEEIVANYKSANCWRTICYSLDGSILVDFFQDNNENELFHKGYLFRNNNITYLLSSFVYRSGMFLEEVYLRIKVYHFESGSLVCELDYLIGIGQSASDETFISYSIYTTEVMHQILSVDEVIFYIGTKRQQSTYTTHVHLSTYHDKSMIYKFLLSNNNISFLEEIEYVGDRIIAYDVNEYLTSTGVDYHHDWNEMEPEDHKSRHYRISLLTNEQYSQVQEVYHIHGSYDDWFGDDFFEHYPLDFKVLTNNDLSFSNYGLIVYNKEYDTDFGTSIHFTNFSSDFVDSLWVKNDSFIGDNQIISSTCISVNNEDHYVMYFRGNQLEIRNRLNGDIIHNQNSTIIPFKIKCKSDGELVFFVEQEDETGYDVYVLEEEIQVSVNEDELPINNYELQNHPNPFNPSTTISFSLNTEDISDCKMIIYNLKGQKVKEFDIFLSEDEGESNSIVWYGTDQNNKYVSSGIYFYQLKVNEEIKQTKKMILLK